MSRHSQPVARFRGAPANGPAGPALGAMGAGRREKNRNKRRPEGKRGVYKPYESVKVKPTVRARTRVCRAPRMNACAHATATAACNDLARS